MFGSDRGRGGSFKGGKRGAARARREDRSKIPGVMTETEKFKEREIMKAQIRDLYQRLESK